MRGERKPILNKFLVFKFGISKREEMTNLSEEGVEGAKKWEGGKNKILFFVSQ